MRMPCGTPAAAGSPAHPDPQPVALVHPAKPNSSAGCESHHFPQLLPWEEPADRNHEKLGNSWFEPLSTSKGRAAQQPECKRGSGLLPSSINLTSFGIGQQLTWGTTIRSGGLGVAHSATFKLGTVRSRLPGSQRMCNFLFQHL